MHRGVRVIGVLAIACGLAAGCSSGGSGAMSLPAQDSAPQAGATQAPSPAESDSGGEAASNRDSGSTVGSDRLAERDRKVARTASMTLRVEDVDETAAAARALATGLGGYTGSERSTEDMATLTLTVPGPKLEVALDRLEKLGKRVSRDVTVEDVTDTVVDVDSRVASQRRSVARARTLLDKATSISEIVSIEGELASREAELESLLARQEALAGQVEMAPVSLTITHRATPVANDEDEPDGFLAGLAGGWDAFTTVLAGLATAIGALAPFLLVFGVPAVAVIWVLRRRRRKPAVTVTPADAT